MARVAQEELARWEPGTPIKTLERMQAVTLEMILRVVFGGGDPQLRDAIRRALQVPMPMLLAMSLWRGRHSAYAAYLRRVRALDALLYERIDARRRRTARCSSVLKGTRRRRASSCATSSSRCSPPGHETTAGALGWALERLARHPEVLARMRDGRRGVPRRRRSRRSCACGRCWRSRRARWSAASSSAAGRCPPGVHVTPCIYLAHRRADLWEDPTAFRPERFLDGAPEPYTFIPFGGGTRRCVGAAFATLEMQEVLRAVAGRFELRPDRPDGRAHAPALDHDDSRAWRVCGATSSPRHADVLPPQPSDRQLPDLQSRARA